MTNRQLYYSRLSNNSRRVWIALLEKGLDFDLVPVQLSGEQFKPEFLALNPFHHIPVLVDEGFRVLESVAIMDYLEAKYPAPSLLPQSPQDLAKVRMIQMVQLNELMPATLPLLRHMVGIPVDPPVLAATQQQVQTVLAFYAAQLGEDYFVSGQFTVADIMAGIAVSVLTMFLTVSIADFPELQAWLERVQARASFQQTQPTAAEVAAALPGIKKMLGG
ncbi:MAG: glutathione S-transferase family protein [Cyanobacteria bacterium P01_G01_bin.54]